MSAAVRLLVGIDLVIVAEVFYHECSKNMHFQLGENSDNKVILCQRRSCINHSFIIIREILILTLSIFIALQGCISWYPLATGVILNDMICRDLIIQYTPCSRECTYQYCPQGQYFPVHSLWRISGTHPRAENIDNVPAMMQINSMQTFAGKQNGITLVVPSRQNLNNINNDHTTSFDVKITVDITLKIN